MAKYETDHQKEVQRKAVVRYDAKAVRFITFKFNRTHDAKLLEWLDRQPNRQGYIKRLVWEDMEAHNLESEKR